MTQQNNQNRIDFWQVVLFVLVIGAILVASGVVPLDLLSSSEGDTQQPLVEPTPATLKITKHDLGYATEVTSSIGSDTRQVQALDQTFDLEKIFGGFDKLPEIPDVPEVSVPDGRMSLADAEKMIKASLVARGYDPGDAGEVMNWAQEQGSLEGTGDWIAENLVQVRPPVLPEVVVQPKYEFYGEAISEQEAEKIIREFLKIYVSEYNEAAEQMNEYLLARAEWQESMSNVRSWIEGNAERSLVYGADYGHGQSYWSEAEISALFKEDGYSEEEINKVFTEYAPSRNGNVAGAGAWLYDQRTSPAYGGTPPEAVAPLNDQDTAYAYNYEGKWLTRPEAEIQLAASFRIWRKDLAGIELGDVVIQAQEQIDEILKWAWEQNAGSLHGYKTEAKERFGYGY